MAIVRLHFWTRATALFVAAICIGTLTSCRQATGKGDQPYLGNFSMGERVRVGPFTYTVLEAAWKQALSTDPQARIPKNRFVVIKLTVTNSGGEETSFPILSLQSSTGQDNPEIIEGVSEVPNWFAPLARNLRPAQTETGTIVFDVPLGAYKLKVQEPADVDAPKFAFIDIPVQLE